MLPLLVLPPFSFLLLSFLFSSVSSYQETPDYYHLCKGPYLVQCGMQNYSISYPFTVADDRREICGPPDYRLLCTEEGNLTIKIRDKYFQVLNIDYGQGFGNEIITVAARDIEVNIYACNVRYDDSTDIDTGLFDLTPQDVSLTLYRCPNDITPLPPSVLPLLPQSCGYTFVWWYLACSAVGEQTRTQLTSCNRTATSVVIKKPLFDIWNQTDPELLGDALQQGFDIKWKAGASWCDRCLNSGGACGYNNTAPSEQTCYCPDGRNGVGSCKEGKVRHHISACKEAHN